MPIPNRSRRFTNRLNILTTNKSKLLPTQVAALLSYQPALQGQVLPESVRQFPEEHEVQAVADPEQVAHVQEQAKYLLKDNIYVKLPAQVATLLSNQPELQGQELLDKILQLFVGQELQVVADPEHVAQLQEQAGGD